MRDFPEHTSYAFQDCPKTFMPAYNETFRTNQAPDATSSSFFCWNMQKNQSEASYEVDGQNFTNFLFQDLL